LSERAIIALKPTKNFILAAKQAKIIALQENLLKKRFSKKDWLEPDFAGAESFCFFQKSLENIGKSARRGAKRRGGRTPTYNLAPQAGRC